MIMKLKILYILLLCIPVTFLACDSLIYDDNGEKNELTKEPVVYLLITKTQPAGTESLNEDATDYEDRVHDLAMLVFDSSTGEKVGEYFDENISFTEKENAFTIKMTPGQRDFYFVANMPMADLKAITTKSAMDVYMNTFRDLDTDLYLAASESKGFPMSRIYLNQNITEGGNIYSPKQFYPDGETGVKLIRAVAKLEVTINGNSLKSGIKNVYYKNAYRKFALTSGIVPPSVSYYDDKPLKKVGYSYIYYMPEAMMTAPSWLASVDHKPINYFLIETLEGTFYEIPIVTDDRTITDADYLNFATGKKNNDLPNYNILRNRHYYYVVKNLQTIEINYTINPWAVDKNEIFMGYGYNVSVGDDGKVRVSNTVNVCAPHSVKLKTVLPFTFTDGTTEKEFSDLAVDAFVEYTLNTIPQTGAGEYLKVYYNDSGSDLPVKTFSK